MSVFRGSKKNKVNITEQNNSCRKVTFYDKQILKSLRLVYMMGGSIKDLRLPVLG